MSTICGREYVMGRGIIPAGVLEYMVVDVAADRLCGTYADGGSATRAMLDYAIEKGIDTQMAVLADYGQGQPLVVVETY